jgi:hypothetical protein
MAGSAERHRQLAASSFLSTTMTRYRWGGCDAFLASNVRASSQPRTL